jgi:hypothetical protein
LPVDGTNGYNGTYPFFSSSANANYPENLSPPVPQNSSTAFGMLGLPDPKVFDSEYDDIKNLYNNSTYPMLSFSQ